jgi:hypothetical protein
MAKKKPFGKPTIEYKPQKGIAPDQIKQVVGDYGLSISKNDVLELLKDAKLELGIAIDALESKLKTYAISSLDPEFKELINATLPTEKSTGVISYTCWLYLINSTSPNAKKLAEIFEEKLFSVFGDVAFPLLKTFLIIKNEFNNIEGFLEDLSDKDEDMLASLQTFISGLALYVEKAKMVSMSVISESISSEVEEYEDQRILQAAVVTTASDYIKSLRSSISHLNTLISSGTSSIYSMYSNNIITPDTPSQGFIGSMIQSYKTKIDNLNQTVNVDMSNLSSSILDATERILLDTSSLKMFQSSMEESAKQGGKLESDIVNTIQVSTDSVYDDFLNSSTSSDLSGASTYSNSTFVSIEEFNKLKLEVERISKQCGSC